MNMFTGFPRWQSGLVLAFMLVALFSAPALAQNKVHVVERGETLASIGRQHDVTVAELSNYNNIDSSDFILVGQQLLVPSRNVTENGQTEYGPFSGLNPLFGIVGEHEKYGADALAVNLNSQDLRGHTTLTREHTVQLGESLSVIGQMYGMSWQYLAIYNGLKDAGSIKYGQTLVIPNIDTAMPLEPPVRNPLPVPDVTVISPATPSSHTYAMRLGESLSIVAEKFEVSLADLMEINGLTQDSEVWVGQNLLLPLRIDGSEPSFESQVMPYVAPLGPKPAAQSLEWAVSPHGESPMEGFNPPSNILHIVKPGETLASIASSYELNSSQIGELNFLAMGSSVTEGQHLKIPVDLTDEVGPMAKRWVQVDLSQQTLTAWEGNEMFLQTDISSGLAQFPTPVGRFRIWYMNPSQTMSGIGYSLDNVKHNMYFYQEYAMHGAYWHNNFGSPMSHGCVNMREEHAEQLYHFASLGMEVWVHN